MSIFLPTSHKKFIENTNLNKFRNTEENSEFGYAFEVYSSFTKTQRRLNFELPILSTKCTSIVITVSIKKRQKQIMT